MNKIINGRGSRFSRALWYTNVYIPSNVNEKMKGIKLDRSVQNKLDFQENMKKNALAVKMCHYC